MGVDLDPIHRDFGLTHVAVHEEPPWALRERPAKDEDPEAEDGPDPEGEPPPELDREERSVEEQEREAASERDIRRRLPRLVAAVGELAELEFVNGGGTGSLARTAAGGAVTELTAGSGFYAPALFDTYRSLDLVPAAFFVLPVVRRPGPTLVTALGGGYPASGAAGADRLPTPYLPEGLHFDKQEGAGEVQTPLRGIGTRRLRVGDRVYLRHAKAGELCERFGSLYLIEGDRIVDQVATYRGDGKAFLSFDVDFFDPAYAPGTGTPEVGGPTSFQGLAYLRACTGIRWAGADVVEVLPALDHAQITAHLAAQVGYEFLSLVALERLSRSAKEREDTRR